MGKTSPNFQWNWNYSDIEGSFTRNCTIQLTTHDIVELNVFKCRHLGLELKARPIAHKDCLCLEKKRKSVNIFHSLNRQIMNFYK